MTIVRQLRSAPFLLGGAVTAMVLSVLLLVPGARAGDRYIQAQATCHTEARMPGWVLPTGIAATAAMAIALVLAILSLRKSAGDYGPSGLFLRALLVAISAIGTLFMALFGIILVITNLPNESHCFG